MEGTLLRHCRPLGPGLLNEAANAGIVDGYPDGTFHLAAVYCPGEAMTMMTAPSTGTATGPPAG